MKDSQQDSSRLTFAFQRSPSLVEEELGVGELTLEGRQRRVSTEALGGTRS